MYDFFLRKRIETLFCTKREEIRKPLLSKLMGKKIIKLYANKNSISGPMKAYNAVSLKQNLLLGYGLLYGYFYYLRHNTAKVITTRTRVCRILVHETFLKLSTMQ